MRKFWNIIFIIAAGIMGLYAILSFILLDDDMMFLGICAIIFSSFVATFLTVGIEGLKNKPTEIEQFIKDVEAGKYEIKKNAEMDKEKNQEEE